MARMLRAIRGGAAGVAMALSTGAALAAPMPQDASQVAPDDRESPEDYAWIDRADALWDAIGDAPPDYSFAFADGEPWAWETADGYWIIVEDAPQGMVSYYFEPNAEGPFLVREPEYSFGYDEGDVAMVYDAGGGALSRAEGTAHFDEGDALYDRGVALRRAVRQRDWRPVDTTAWAEVSLVLIGLQHRWDEGRLRHPGWRRHRDLPNVIAWHRRWDGEHRRRIDSSDRFRRWRAGGYQGPPPGRPGGWVHGPQRPGRPDGHIGRPGGRPLRPPVPATGPQPGPIVARPPTPAVPVGATPRPARPWHAEWRGRDGRPGRDRVDGARPPAPATTPPPVAPGPGVRPRPEYRPRPAEGSAGPGRGFPRPERPAFTSPAAPAAGVPQRPAFTPPQPRPASAPAPRASAPRPAPPPRPSKIDRGESLPPH